MGVKEVDQGEKWRTNRLGRTKNFIKGIYNKKMTNKSLLCCRRCGHHKRPLCVVEISGIQKKHYSKICSHRLWMDMVSKNRYSWPWLNYPCRHLMDSFPSFLSSSFQIYELHYSNTHLCPEPNLSPFFHLIPILQAPAPTCGQQTSGLALPHPCRLHYSSGPEHGSRKRAT